MSSGKAFLKSFVFDRSGISSVEYALLLALVGGGILASIVALSTAVSGEIVDSANCVSSDDPLNDCD
jgi:Flp pilus assembly pilin Flp